MRTLGTISRRAGFTLLEILAVVSILSVLLGIVLSAIHAAQNQSKRAIARAEVRSVESALKAYLDHYGNWSLMKDPLSASSGEESSGDRWFVVDGDVSAALEGAVADSANAKSMNPDGQPFLEFSRHLRADDGRRVPVNPWNGRKGVMSSSSRPDSPDLGDARFFVAIDWDFDGVVDLQSLGLTSAEFRMPKPRSASASDPSGEVVERVSRPVVVWTYNPENTRDEAIVSWME